MPEIEKKIELIEETKIKDVIKIEEKNEVE